MPWVSSSAEAKRYADAVRWIKRAIDFAPDETTRNSYREQFEDVLCRRACELRRLANRRSSE